MEEALKRGYAETLEEWWFLLEHESGWPTFEKPILVRYLSAKELGEIRRAKEKKDAPTVYRLLDRAWWNLPDAKWIHSLPGFGRLCDLCSDFPHEEQSDDHS